MLAVSPRNRIDLSATYLDGHYSDYLPLGAAGPDFKGRKLDRTPTSTISAGYTYTLPLANSSSLVGSVRTRLSDSYVLTNFSSVRQFRQPSYTRTDASLQYNAPGNRWYVAAFARNLENYVVIAAIDGSNNISPGDPRTFGVRGGFHF